MEKKPPFAAPLTITNTAKGAIVSDTGQMANMLMALMRRQKNSVLSAPSLSQRRPQRTLPTADEKLKPAKSPAPVDVDSPIDELYSGKKKGGTSRGKVATAPAMKTMRKRASLNSDLGSSVTE